MKRLSVLMLVSFVDMLGLMIIAPLMPFYARHFGAQEWMVGFLFSGFAVAQLISSPVWGRVSDRYGRRPALLIGLASSGFAYVIFAYAQAFWVLVLSRLVQGAGGGTTGVAQAYVADTMAPAERAKALGWLSAATSAGVIIGPAVSSLTSQLGTAAPGLAAALLVGINLILAYRWLPESHTSRQAHAAGAPRRPPIWHTLWDVVRRPGAPVAQMIWIYAVGMLALNSLIAVLGLYLQDGFGLTERNAGYVFTVFGIVGVVLRTAPVGWVNARFGEVRTLRVGAAFLILGLILMPLPRSLWFFIACLMLVPAGTAFLFPATTSLVSQRSNPREVGLTMGVQQTMRGIMAIAGPIGATALYALPGTGHVLPFWVAAGVMAVALLLARRVEHVPAPVVGGAATPGVVGS